jgi:nicotinamide-nucleotide amidase
MTASLEQLLQALRQKKWTIALAESCTGGLLSATFAEMAGVSDVFLGSVVSYSNEMKKDVLNVNESTLKAVGAVSEETAREMARGILLVAKSDCCIAITGIAGPSGGSVQKPVGTVFVAIKGPDFEKVERKLFAGSRSEIQRQSVECGISSLLNQLVSGAR